jgi:16S rRNA (uracil1498-N3)-methyltransferase
MRLFYSEKPIDKIYCFDKEESKHLKVLRIQNSEKIFLTDGKGKLYELEIISNLNFEYIAKVIDIKNDFRKRNYKLHIAIAPTKNPERFEWFLEKATEIGVDKITPLICARSEKFRLNFDRMQKVIIAAMKQSFSAYLPELAAVSNFEDFVKNESASNKFIAHCIEGDLKIIPDLYDNNHPDSIILIGPEGDFSEEEIEQAMKLQYSAVTFGNRRLRTETAGIVACENIHFIHQTL